MNLKLDCNRENPSLGKIGMMYYDQRNNRIKFFSEALHYTKENIDSLVEQGISMMHTNRATRFTARFLASNSMDYNNDGIEAVIPLEGIFKDFSLIYLGINTPNRQDNDRTLAKESQMVNDLYLRQPDGRYPSLEDYQAERLVVADDRNVNSLFELYKEAYATYTVELNHKNIADMINSSSPFYIARHSETQEIVSAAIAEISGIKTNLGSFRICELSEMATRREHRGRGLVTFITRILVNEIYKNLNLIYAEARSCHLPINRVFYNMDFHFGGRLNKQCILSGDHEINESGPYENLNVWYYCPNSKREK